jgi:hypothetical protein
VARATLALLAMRARITRSSWDTVNASVTPRSWLRRLPRSFELAPPARFAHGAPPY